VRLPSRLLKQTIEVLRETGGVTVDDDTGDRTVTLAVEKTVKGSIQPVTKRRMALAAGGVDLNPPFALAYLPYDALTSPTGFTLRCGGLTYEPQSPASDAGGMGAYWLVELQAPRVAPDAGS
jgi:hypothetical protein